MHLLEREDQAALLAAVCRSAASGRGGVVLVTGEPGIGKSALVASFTRSLPAGRALVGLCDDLATPRPLGPLRDLVGGVGAALGRALASGAPAPEVHDLLLAELGAPPVPSVLVLEDVHWADDATVDVVKIVGRRIADLPAVLVLTYRDGELAEDHPLRMALAALPPGVVTRLALGPLSRGAVASLVGEDAGRVHALTGGNPFYVTELVAAGSGVLPPSVSEAVAGRIAALGPEARRLLELVSVVPARTDIALLDVLVPGWNRAAEEPERRGLLVVGPRSVAFRHELARTALEAALPEVARRRLHARVLAALQASGADPAELVHHAAAAADRAALAASALPAARRAAALGSNREAFAHYRRAVEFAGNLDAADRGALFEEYATAAYLLGRNSEALAAIGAATAAYGEVAAPAALGRCARTRSRLHWYMGNGEAARSEALAAVAILEPLGESAELARACSGVSQLAMLAGHRQAALTWGRRAADMAERSGDRATHVHALVNIGTVESEADPDDTATLTAAHATADAAGEWHEAVRALINRAWNQLLWVRPAAALAVAEQAVAYAAAHEVDALGSYVAVMAGWLRLRAGDWSAAAVAEDAARHAATVTQLLAKVVLAERAVRRGDADARERLDDVAAQADRTGELQRIVPVLELEIEWSLTTGAPMPGPRIERALTLARTDRDARWGGSRLAGWVSVAGLHPALGGPAADAYAAMIDQDWARAAAAFGAVGWSYDRALMLSLLDDRAALAEALETARMLGATPLVGRVTGRLRELGLPVPHGRRDSTRTNAAGLTDRQLEVLLLVAEGLTNAEIADRLVVSPRTTEHHVAALLAKLGVTTRRDAARRAAELGLLPGRR